MQTQNTSTLKLARLLSWSIAAIFILLPFHALLTTWLGSNFGHLNAWRLWKEILIVFVVLPMAVVLVWREPNLRRWLRDSWFVRLFTFYLILNFMMGIWSLKHDQVNAEALAGGLLASLRFFGFFIICAIVAKTDNFLKRYWLKLTIGPAAIVVVFGLLQKFILPLNFLSHFGYGPKTIPAYQTLDTSSQIQRVQSSLRGANPLGAYLTLIVPVWLAGFGKKRFLQITGTLASLGALFFSYSRSAWVGTGLAVGLLVWWAIHKYRYWLLALVCFLALVVAGAVYIQRNNQNLQYALFHTSSTSTSLESPNAVRADALRSAWNDIVYQPLGRGPGTAGPISVHNDPFKPRIAENYYLQIGQEVGVIGIALFVAMNGLIARQLWCRRADILARALLASLVGISIINLVNHAWADDTLSLLWWGLAGVALAPGILKAKSREHETPIKPA